MLRCAGEAEGRQRTALVKKYLELAPPNVGGCGYLWTYSSFLVISGVLPRTSAQCLALPPLRPSPTASAFLFILHAHTRTRTHTGGWGVFYCASFFLKFISFLSTYFPPTRDLSTSQPAQSLVEVWWPARGFLGEPPSGYSLPKPTSLSAGHWFSTRLPGSTRVKSAPGAGVGVGRTPSRRATQGLARISPPPPRPQLIPLTPGLGAAGLPRRT